MGFIDILCFFAHYVISYNIYRLTITFNNVSYRIGEILIFIYLYFIFTNKIDYYICADIYFLTIPLELLYLYETKYQTIN